MAASRSTFAAVLATLLLMGRPGRAAEAATGTTGPNTPVAFAPPGSLLSQTKPGQPPSPGAATPEMSFPSVEALVRESAAAAPAGEQAFYDPEHGLRGRIPPGWKLKDSFRGPENVVFLFEVPEHARAQVMLNYRKLAARQTLDAEQTIAWLEREALAQSNQRRWQGIGQYRAQKGKMRTVGDHPALTWLANYTATKPRSAKGPAIARERWIESQTQIRTPDGTAIFSLRAPEADMPALEAQFESLVQSVSLP